MRREKKNFWERNGHYFIMGGIGIFIVLLGYGAGNMVFNSMQPKTPVIKKPVETQVETPIVETPQEEPETPIVEEPEEEKPDTDIEVKTESEKEIINYQTKQVEDDTLEAGKTKVVQEGALGEKLLVYEVSYEKGKEVNRKLISEVISKEPQDRITHIGTKKVSKTTTKIIEETKTIPFATVYEEDDEQYVGYLHKKVDGVNGTKTLSIKITYVDGVEKSREVLSEVVTKKAINEVIVTGTKPLETETPGEPETPESVG